MTTQRKQTGNSGESLAQKHLIAKGYRIVDTNWRCSVGEIDIIAEHNDTIAFVEVRTRRTATTEDAFVSITPQKRDRLIQLAHIYLNEKDLGQVFWRIDVIGIAMPRGKQPIIEHIEDALGW